jgi:hypothetical protein
MSKVPTEDENASNERGLMEWDLQVSSEELED